MRQRESWKPLQWRGCEWITVIRTSGFLLQMLLRARCLSMAFYNSHLHLRFPLLPLPWRAHGRARHVGTRSWGPRGLEGPHRQQCHGEGERAASISKVLQRRGCVKAREEGKEGLQGSGRDGCAVADQDNTERADALDQGHACAQEESAEALCRGGKARGRRKGGGQSGDSDGRGKAPTITRRELGRIQTETIAVARGAGGREGERGVQVPGERRVLARNPGPACTTILALTMAATGCTAVKAATIEGCFMRASAHACKTKTIDVLTRPAHMGEGERGGGGGWGRGRAATHQDARPITRRSERM